MNMKEVLNRLDGLYQVVNIKGIWKGLMAFTMK